MFENIIGHADITDQIKKEIDEGKFPRSSVFTGPEYSGKQTLALETARILTCRNKGEWNCMCEPCRLQRHLLHPSTILFGYDNFLPEIIVSREIMIKNRGEQFSRFLFLRSVRKLVKRFDPVFTDESDSKIKKVISYIRDLEEIIKLFHPDEDLDFIEIEKKSSDVLETCKKVLKEVNISGISVDQIRRINYWVHTSGYDDKKVIIIENSEKMNDSARNAILKVLEEPPEGVYFIFLTSRYGEIIPTIKSRLRKYKLKDRNLSESRDVIEKIFRDKPGVEFSLKDFFNSWTTDNDTMKKAARDFIIDIFNTDREKYLIDSDLRKIIKTASSDQFRGFLEHVLELSGKLISNEEFMMSSHDVCMKMGKLTSLVNSGYRNKEMLNINPELIIENIFFRMRNSI